MMLDLINAALPTWLGFPENSGGHRLGLGWELEKWRIGGLGIAAAGWQLEIVSAASGDRMNHIAIC